MKKKGFDAKAYKLDEYPEVIAVDFPKEIYIAYAVCGKQCGVREFIVDGQTQVCQCCGRLMFRTEVERYVLAKKKSGSLKKSPVGWRSPVGWVSEA